MKIENKEQILKELADLRYTRGWSRQMIVNHLKEEYGLELSRAYEYIREMMAEVGRAYDNTNPNALEDAIEYMEKMKTTAHGQGNHKLALEWQKELNKVQQLYIQKIDITSGGEKITININTKKED